MSGLQIGFDKPLYLWLLLLVPLLWALSFHSLASLGRLRRALALLLRTLVLVSLICALAEIQIMQTSEKVTVIYLLDQSESIPLEKRQAMLDYVVRAVDKHRDGKREDRAGVVVFGRNASIEIPPFDDDIVALGGLDTYLGLRTDATNLAAALKLAQASFTEDSSKRVVIVTDGNENMGDARGIANTLKEDGIGIDVVPVKLTARAEVAVDRVMLPSDIRVGQPLNTRVVVNNFSEQPIKGTLKFTRREGQREDPLGQAEVVLTPGKRVFEFSDEIKFPGAYTYQADFVPDDPADDLMSQNNRATSFTHVEGKGSVLLIEDWQNTGEFDHLVQRLLAEDIEVTLRASDNLFANLQELQAYDCVMLANVPRSSGDDAQSVTSFTDDQIKALVRNTEQHGCGLIMLGGPNSFGAGGWANTELEKAMPVDFQIKNAKIRAVGAICLMMHASELADGNFWQKEVAEKAILALGPMDYCGLIHWDFGGDAWLWGEPWGIIQVGNRRNMMLARLGRMQPGDMPEFDPAMKKALTSFRRVDASVKLMIVISDGDPSPPSSLTLRRYKDARIQVTTVAVGTHGRAGHKTLQDIAAYTGGRYFVVTDPRALPKIYVSEVRRVARPLVFEPDNPVKPRISSHEILQGIDDLPPISGFVMTTRKENPLVEVAAVSPLPADEKNATILAAWTYGLGRTAVLTTDAGHRWADSWIEWENYDKLFSQLVRWSMRPASEKGKFSVSTDVEEGKVRIVVNALQEDAFQSFLNMVAHVTDPEMNDLEVDIRQVAPGRYVGEFNAPQDGNYFLTISPGRNHAPIRTGVNVPYSNEFRDRETNMALLTALARLRPEGGQPGAVIEGEMDPQELEPLLAVNTFRRGLAPSISSQSKWPFFLVLTACVFFADIFVRRVTVNFDWVPPAWQRLRRKLWGGDQEAAVEESLERLRSRKAAVAEEIDERRAAARFEPVVDEAPGGRPASLDEVLEDTAAAPPAGPPAGRPPAALAPDAAEEESYTSRLLKAKRQAWKDQQ